MTKKATTGKLAFPHSFILALRSIPASLFAHGFQASGFAARNRMRNEKLGPNALRKSEQVVKSVNNQRKADFREDTR
jgi:hypothetical protein